ncbi:alpha/beta-hydrolase [Polyplosphaeria fusca]|uniref:Alpha/beta-hydrolase n=1 Tax=Polyplosphaeria fusca TaxID=682080 RepID=A0A9P4QT54_9PLEO|nr:alpha/beta-hydrolase [Polyplosphaeria fusca]
MAPWTVPFTVCLLTSLCSAAVNVRKTSKGPTGYEVDFSYFDSSATTVAIGGGLPTFTDEFHTNPDGSAHWDPHQYQPGWFPGTSLNVTPYRMNSNGNGSWTYTMPLPSGTYTYAFQVNCVQAKCTNVVDPDNAPFVNVQGDQLVSHFQVPFDRQFQSYADLNLNFDYALPAPKEQRGIIRNVNYSSPGSVHPAPDVHDFVVYLPPGYSNSTAGKNYPILYLSHGGWGNGQEWENLGATSQILDNLISQKHLEPTVVVMPSFYNLAPEYKFVYGSEPLNHPGSDFIRKIYMEYLFPYIEANFAVSTDPKRRAFGGFSLGSSLTYEMYINNTDYFSYFGMFSGAVGPLLPRYSLLNSSMLQANPALKEKGIFTSAGLFDLALPDTRMFQAAMQSLGVPFVSRIEPWGFHVWNTWQDSLWQFGKLVLWKELPRQSNGTVTSGARP